MFSREEFEDSDFSWAGVKERLLEVPASSDWKIWFMRVGGMVLLQMKSFIPAGVFTFSELQCVPTASRT